MGLEKKISAKILLEQALEKETQRLKSVMKKKAGDGISTIGMLEIKNTGHMIRLKTDLVNRWKDHPIVEKEEVRDCLIRLVNLEKITKQDILDLQKLIEANASVS